MNKQKITQLADSSMEELTKMAEETQSFLWLLDLDGETEILNAVEYKRQFGPIASTLNEVLDIKVDNPLGLVLRLSDLGNAALLEKLMNDL